MSDEVFLPPREPTDNPTPTKRRGQARKTILLWVVLIIVFFTVYQLIVSNPPGAETVEHTGPSIWGSLLWPVGGIGLIILFVIFLKWQFRGNQRFDEDQEPGLLALNEDRLEDAASIFTEVHRRYRAQLSFAPVAKYNLGITQLRQGKLAEALRSMVEVERGMGLSYTAHVRLLAAIYLAKIYALLGDLDTANRWLADGRRRLVRSANRLVYAAQLRLAEITIACRAGDVERTLALIDGDQRQLEASLTYSSMRVLWLYRAYLAATAAAPRDQGEVELWLAKLRPYRDDEFGYLASHWPELRTFLESYGLS